MKIAFISYEYPPDTADGGIATYVHQAANMLQTRGNHVEVFAGSRHRSGVETESCGVLVHRLQIRKRADFPKAIARMFADRHMAIGFDVVEGPDYGAEAEAAVRLVPDIPFVVKLHTPRIIIEAYNCKPSLLTYLRVKVGALRRGTNPFKDMERAHALKADEIAAPSRAIGEKIIEYWGVDPQIVHEFPLPYSPSPGLLKIPTETYSNTVTFLGRLENRKGVIDLAQAIPTILRQCPGAKFRFVGRPSVSPDPKRDMGQYLADLLKPHHRSVEFTGPVALDQIPSIMAETDVCVFPSLFESFGLVCLEAMTAGRGVVGSSSGVMTEMLNSGEAGRLIPPGNPQAIAQAVTELLSDPPLRIKLGSAARERVLREYNFQRIGDLQEASYRRAITRRQSKMSAHGTFSENLAG